MDWGRILFVDVWPGWAGGALISVTVLLLMLTRNRQLGVSFCYAYVVDRANDWFESRTAKPDPVATNFPIPGATTDAAPPEMEDNPANFPVPGALPMPSGTSGGGAMTFDTNWPLVFLGGIFLGGVMSAALSHAVSGSPWTFDLSYAGFDNLWKMGPLAKAGILFGGGILVGFGTRMTGGCTSGHAIMGAPALQKTSFISMMTFMGAGMITTFLLYALL